MTAEVFLDPIVNLRVDVLVGNDMDESHKKNLSRSKARPETKVDESVYI